MAVQPSLSSELYQWEVYCEYMVSLSYLLAAVMQSLPRTKFLQRESWPLQLALTTGRREEVGVGFVWMVK